MTSSGQLPEGSQSYIQILGADKNKFVGKAKKGKKRPLQIEIKQQRRSIDNSEDQESTSESKKQEPYINEEMLKIAQELVRKMHETSMQGNDPTR